jgi:hypothetical protein
MVRRDRKRSCWISLSDPPRVLTMYPINQKRYKKETSEIPIETINRS